MANSIDNISKYAISYMSFDEVSGNVLDNIGGYVGTIYNAPTRVTGWNGKGNAISFNGTNQYVQMNNKIIPVGAKSIRFKIKSSSNTHGIILSESGWNNANKSGFAMLKRDDGTIGVLFNLNVNIPSYAMVSNSLINDGHWHDVLFTWDGTMDTDSLKLYIDNMSIPNVTATPNSLESFPYSRDNTVIGRMSTATNSTIFYFSGQLDQLEIYDKVIAPIPDKHLVLHNAEYKYHDGTSWQTTANTTENFIQYGHNDLSHITESQWLELTGDKSVVVWSDFEDKESASIVLNRDTFTPLDVIGNEYDIVIYDTDTKIQQLELIASPDDQELISLQDIPLIGVETINKVTVNGTGSGKVGFSIDGGLTYRVFKDGQWIPIANMGDGNTFDEANNLTTAQMGLLRGDSNIIRMSFFITHDTVLEDVKMICSFEGSERLAPSNIYDVSYDMVTKTVTYKIKKAATYMFTYTDVE